MDSEGGGRENKWIVSSGTMVGGERRQVGEDDEVSVVPQFAYTLTTVHPNDHRWDCCCRFSQLALL